jgi:hypothetical protein
MHRVFPPSEPPDGGARSSSALSSLEERNFAELVPFSHRSASRIFIRQPGCIPSPVVTQDGDHQFQGGEKQAGLRPSPLPQLQGCSSSVLGRGVRRVGACLCAGSGPLLPLVIGGRAFVVRGAGSYRVSGSPARAASAPLPVPPPAEAAGRGFSADEIVGATRGLTSNSTAFCLSSPLEWGCGRGPCDSSIRPEVIAAAVRPLGAEVVVAAALRAAASHPSAFCCSAGPPTWGVIRTCGGGTGVPFVMAPCVPVSIHRGCRGLNMYVFLARSRVFSSFRALGLACRLARLLRQA